MGSFAESPIRNGNILNLDTSEGVPGVAPAEGAADNVASSVRPAPAPLAEIINIAHLDPYRPKDGVNVVRNTSRDEGMIAYYSMKSDIHLLPGERFRFNQERDCVIVGPDLFGGTKRITLDRIIDDEFTEDVFRYWHLFDARIREPPGSDNYTSRQAKYVPRKKENLRECKAWMKKYWGPMLRACSDKAYEKKVVHEYNETAVLWGLPLCKKKEEVINIIAELKENGMERGNHEYLAVLLKSIERLKEAWEQKRWHAQAFVMLREEHKSSFQIDFPGERRLAERRMAGFNADKHDLQRLVNHHTLNRMNMQMHTAQSNQMGLVVHWNKRVIDEVHRNDMSGKWLVYCVSQSLLHGFSRRSRDLVLVENTRKSGHEGFTHEGGVAKIKAVALAMRAAGKKRSEFMELCEDAKRGEFFLCNFFDIPADFQILNKKQKHASPTMRQWKRRNL